MPTGKCHIAERDLQTGKERILFDIPSGMVSLKCSNDYSKLAVSSRQNGIEIIDTKTGKKLKEFKKAGLSAWSPDGRSIMARKSNNLSYHVISYADGSSKEYDLSENLPKGDRMNIHWSPLGNQIALSFRFSQFDGYILHNVIPAEKK
jgi:WD40 repeat protein